MYLRVSLRLPTIGLEADCTPHFISLLKPQMGTYEIQVPQ